MRPSYRMFISLIFLAAVISAGVVASAAQIGFGPHHGSPPPLPDCTCRFMGQNVPLGTLRCLRTPDGPRLAECVKEVNVTSWRPSRVPCPEASLLRPRG